MHSAIIYYSEIIRTDEAYEKHSLLSDTKKNSENPVFPFKTINFEAVFCIVRH